MRSKRSRISTSSRVAPTFEPIVIGAPPTWESPPRGTTDAGWTRRIRLELEDLFDSDVVDPTVAEVVLVQEPVAGQESKALETDLPRIIRESRSTGMADSVFSCVDIEPVYVDILPPHGNLDNVVKSGDARLARHQVTPPDHGEHKKVCGATPLRGAPCP